MRWLAILVAALGVAVCPTYASAQKYAPNAESATTDDVDWETRSIPYDGGPIRPGAEIEGSISAWTWVGGSALLGGWAISATGATPRTYSIIPFAGPWIAAFATENDDWSDSQTVFMIVSGVLQPAGLIVLMYALFNPSLSLVYDAPIGAPSPHETRLSLLPGASGADFGATLSIRWF